MIDSTAGRILEWKEKLAAQGYDCQVIVFASTPSMPCYLKYEGTFLSPGTAFITDYSYWTKFPDLPFLPAAALVSRVISTPGKGEFTIDAGYKHIAADPPGLRGLLLGYEEAEPVFHCEEHWAFRMPAGKEELGPKLGETVYIIPTHICPTTALYPYANVVKGGQLKGRWDVTARDLVITV